jgi:6-phosphogluconolactonase (cycloisomerase 2 family)
LRPNAGNARDLAAISTFLMVAACGGGNTRVAHPIVPPPPACCHNVGGYTAGLSGSGLALSYNGGAPVAIANNGAFTLTTTASRGSSYSVAVVGQPTNRAQACTVSNGSGTVDNGNVMSVLVYCPRTAARWAYVATEGAISLTSQVPTVAGSLSAYAIDTNTGALLLVTGSTVPTGPAVGTVQWVPHSPYLWALSIGDTSAADNNTVSSIYAYTVDANSGLLTANAGNPFFTLNGTSATPAACSGIGGQGSTIAVTFAPSGTYGYDLLQGNPAANNGGTYVFTVSSGAPQLSGLAASNACVTPTTIDPSGQFAYYGIAWAGGTYSLVAATVDPTTGALTAVPRPATLFVESGPAPAIVDPFGRFVYVLSGPSGNFIYGYSIDPVSGEVTEISGMPIARPAGAMSLLISPDGQFAYITASGGLYAYSISAWGALTPVGSAVPLQIAAGQMLAAPGITTATQIDPSGQFLYASASAGSGQQGIYAYTRDPSTGALTLVPGSPFGVTLQNVPLQLAIIN